MPDNRFYIEEALEIGGVVTLKGDEGNHVIRVMRARVGEEIELINGKGFLANALIQMIQKDKVSCLITTCKSSCSTSFVILAQSICRFNRLEYILEKATELNVREIWLFPSTRSEKSTFSINQEQRMKSLLIAAMKQSGRLDLPSIILKPPLLAWKSLDEKLLFGDTRENAPYLWNAIQAPTSSPLVFAIGPEGGFTDDEVEFLEMNLKGLGVKLHDNILRVDTAPLTALSLLQQYKE